MGFSPKFSRRRERSRSPRRESDWRSRSREVARGRSRSPRSRSRSSYVRPYSRRFSRSRSSSWSRSRSRSRTPPARSRSRSRSGLTGPRRSRSRSPQKSFAPWEGRAFERPQPKREEPRQEKEKEKPQKEKKDKKGKKEKKEKKEKKHKKDNKTSDKKAKKEKKERRAKLRSYSYSSDSDSEHLGTFEEIAIVRGALKEVADRIREIKAQLAMLSVDGSSSAAAPGPLLLPEGFVKEEPAPSLPLLERTGVPRPAFGAFGEPPGSAPDLMTPAEDAEAIRRSLELQKAERFHPAAMTLEESLAYSKELRGRLDRGDARDLPSSVQQGPSCKHCGGPHWSMTCPSHRKPEAAKASVGMGGGYKAPEEWHCMKCENTNPGAPRPMDTCRRCGALYR